LIGVIDCFRFGLWDSAEAECLSNAWKLVGTDWLKQLPLLLFQAYFDKMQAAV
jgi:hypothetical protein